jgi:peptidoglycan/LPS O-acetylase OafA/YrhL
MSAKQIAKTPASDASSRLGGLDMFRFLLCAGVVFAHYWFLGPMGFGQGRWPAVNHPWLSLIEYAVHCFFMISGFAVMYTIKGRTAVAFAIARLARMWPAIAICSVITWIVVRHAFDWSPGFRQVIASWSLIELGFHRGAGADWAYWTMTFELRFYLFIFVAMLVADVHKVRLPLLAAWLAVTACDAFVYTNDITRFFALDFYASCFIIGALTYVIWEQRGLQRRIAIGLLLLAFPVMSKQLLLEHEAFKADFWRTIPALEVTVWFVPVICWGLLVGSLSIVRPFEKMPWLGKLAVFLGTVTYPLYLLHQLVGYRIIDDMSGMLPAWAVWIAPWIATALVFGVSVIVAVWWEPMVRPVVQKVLKAVAERFQYTRPVKAQPRNDGRGPTPTVHAE